MKDITTVTLQLDSENWANIKIYAAYTRRSKVSTLNFILQELFNKGSFIIPDWDKICDMPIAKTILWEHENDREDKLAKYKEAREKKKQQALAPSNNL